MYRDFTEQAKEQLKGYIDDVTPHGFFETLGDRITDFFRNFVETDITNYAGNFQGYQKRILDVKNVGKKNIDKLFDKEWGVEDSYKSWLSGACDTYDDDLIKSFRALSNMLDAKGAGFHFSRQNLDAFNNASEAVSESAAQIATAKEEIETKEKEIEKLKKEKKGKRGEYNLFSADPVNLATGNFIYEKTDIRPEGEMALSFRRFYNAQDKTMGVLGQGYRHNHEIALQEEENEVEVIMEDGGVRFFVKTEEGYEGILATRDLLEKSGEGNETQYVMTTPEGEKYRFNALGKLFEREDLNERKIRYTYNEADQLVRAESDRGDFLTFTYYPNGRLASVTDRSDRTVHYVYENERLAEVIMANGNRYYYRYTQNGKMQEIKNAREVITVKNTYDDWHRITRQDFPDGSQMLYEYQGNELILTERNGSRITYTHDEKLRNTDVKYEDGTWEHYEYNEKSQKTLVRDRNGNTTRYSYDARGNVVKVINALGQISTMTYDANNRLLAMKVNRKVRIRNTYDKNGNLLTAMGADGNGSVYTYDDHGRVTSVEDADHDVTRLSYDARGNIIQVSINGVRNSFFVYDDNDNVVLSRDGNGNETTYRYDAWDRLIGVKNALGEETFYTYDLSGKVTRVQDFDGHEMHVTYNLLNKEETLTDKEGNITELTYDSMWNVASVKRADGGVVRYTYDKNDRLAEVVAPEGNAIRYQYDGNGNLVAEENGCRDAIRYTYDALNRRKSVIDPQGNETKYAYDGSGNLVRETDALGNETTYVYDEDGRLISETDVLGNTTTYAYTAGGKRKEVCYADGTCDHYSYENGQLVESIRTSGERYHYTYDGNGNLILQKNALGEEVAFSYDALNRMTEITLPTGAVRKFAYNATGKLTQIVDENGNETRYTYSPNGNLTEVIDAMGGVTGYDYDVMGNLIQVTRSGKDAEDEITRYEWNRNDQIIKMIDPLGSEESYIYDMAGRMIEKQDRDGYVTKVTYDALGNVTGLKYADEKEVLFSYDALSHLKEMRDWNGVTSIVSDAMGRTISVTDDLGKSVQYEWNSVGQKARMSYPDGSEVTYQYNEHGLLDCLATETGQTKYVYDTMGRIKEKNLPNGIHTQYQYNNIGKLEEICHIGKDFEERYHYIYDAVGNKIEARKNRNGIEEDSGIYSYHYDARNQLVGVLKDGKVQREYGYDSFGNRIYKKDHGEDFLETVYKYNSNNQLIEDINSQVCRQYQYDKRGNLLTIAGNEGILKKFTFDATNTLCSAWERRGTQEKQVGYQYNGMGNRIGQILGDHADPEKTIRYTIDLTRQYHNMLAEEIETKESLETRQYIYDFNVVGMKQAVGADYFILDDLGSTMGVYDMEGNLQESYAYDEYGNEYGKIIDAKDRFQPFGYTGYQQESVGNVYYAQARRYDAGSGRFISEDIIKGATIVPISLNHYVYCWNAPYNYVDLNGMWVHILVGAAVGAVTGVAGEIIGDVISGEPITAKGLVSSGLGGAVGGAVLGATGSAALAGAATSGVSTLTKGVWEMADGTREVSGKSALKLGLETAGSTLIGAGTGELVDFVGGKLASKFWGVDEGTIADTLGQKMINKIPKMTGRGSFQALYNTAVTRVETTGTWTLKSLSAKTWAKCFTVNALKNIPETIENVGVDKINDILEQVLEKNATNIITNIYEHSMKAMNGIAKGVATKFNTIKECECVTGGVW